MRLPGPDRWDDPEFLRALVLRTVRKLQLTAAAWDAAADGGGDQARIDFLQRRANALAWQRLPRLDRSLQEASG